MNYQAKENSRRSLNLQPDHDVGSIFQHPRTFIPIFRRISSDHLHSPQMVKIQRSCPDQWEASPAKVTSRFRLSFISWSSGSTFHSPICGFGWRLQCTINYSSPAEQATLDISWDPNLCHRLDLGEITVSVQILNMGSSHGYQDSLYMSGGVRSLCSDYTVTRKRRIEVVLSLTFDSSIGLSFPSQPRANDFLLEFLHASLTRPSPADTKLLLYSARKGRRATRPKPLFVYSNILRNSAFYWETSTQSSC